MFRACHVVLSIHCSLVVACLEKANLLALLYVMFSFVFITFSCGVLGQVWYFLYRFLIFAFFLTLEAIAGRDAYCTILLLKIVSEYDQEMQQSQTAD